MSLKRINKGTLQVGICLVGLHWNELLRLIMMRLALGQLTI